MLDFIHSFPLYYSEFSDFLQEKKTLFARTATCGLKKPRDLTDYGFTYKETYLSLAFAYDLAL